jgi:hypothetical protein
MRGTTSTVTLTLLVAAFGVSRNASAQWSNCNSGTEYNGICFEGSTSAGYGPTIQVTSAGGGTCPRRTPQVELPSTAILLLVKVSPELPEEAGLAFMDCQFPAPVSTALRRPAGVALIPLVLAE